MTTKLKACVDCRHRVGEWWDSCGHPELVSHDPVSGPVAADCRAMRRRSPCGPEGKLWAPQSAGSGMFWVVVLACVAAVLMLLGRA